MTAVLAPDLPETVPRPTAGSATELPPASRSWLSALPRPADVAAGVGWLGEWIGHASLEPARVILRR